MSTVEKIRSKRKELEGEIETLEEELENIPELDSLEEDLEGLRYALDHGEIPEEEGNVPGVEKVPVNEETGRPPRGARTRQIKQAIDVISKEKETFEAKKIFELLQKADDSITDDKRAYLYSKLNDFREEGMLEKVGRGTWKIG